MPFEYEGNCFNTFHHSYYKERHSNQKELEQTQSDDIDDFDLQNVSTKPFDDINQTYKDMDSSEDPMISGTQNQIRPLAERKFVGLKNMGNTCYVNSCLQALYSSNKLRQHLLEIKPHATGPLHNLLSKLFHQMDKRSVKSTLAMKHCVIKPDDFINEFRSLKPQFVKHEQHDAQEFLTILIECIHQEANKAKKNLQHEEPKNAQEAWNFHLNNIDNSFYSRLFVGQLESNLECLTCKHVSLSWSCFWQLPLHLTESGNDEFTCKERFKEVPLSIEQCIQDYTASEILTDDCAPFCENCNQKRTSSKQQTICRAPHYLIIHLKRFTHTGMKMNRKVVINPMLQLCGKRFTIYSCVLHRGSETKGHYFTLYRNDSNEWILFDDENISKELTNQYVESMLQNYSYICFYRAISMKLKNIPENSEN